MPNSAELEIDKLLKKVQKINFKNLKDLANEIDEEAIKQNAIRILGEIKPLSEKIINYLQREKEVQDKTWLILSRNQIEKITGKLCDLQSCSNTGVIKKALEKKFSKLTLFINQKLLDPSYNLEETKKKIDGLLCQQALVSDSTLNNSDKIQEAFTCCLKSIAELNAKNETGKIRIFISYAWPLPGNREQELWLQPFLKNLHKNLECAGFHPILDIIDNKAGGDIYKFAAQAATSEYALLICTKSLYKKFTDDQFKVVKVELNHLQNKYDLDIKSDMVRVFPLLLGSHTGTYPEEYKIFKTVRETFLKKSYTEGVKEIISWMCDNSKINQYNELWKQFYAEYPKLKDVMPKDQINETLSEQLYKEQLKQLEKEKFYKEIFRQHEDEIKIKEKTPEETEIKKDKDTNHLKKPNRFVNQEIIEKKDSIEFLLKERYKKEYKNIPAFREGEKSQPMEESYVNLAIVKEIEQKDKEKELKNCKKTEEENKKEYESSIFFREELLKTQETIYGAKELIQIEDLFKPQGKESKQDLKPLVIFGRAGIGKTVLFQHMAYLWGQGKLFSQFKAVFLISLRELEGYSATKILSPIERQKKLIEILGNSCLQSVNVNDIKKQLQSYLEDKTDKEDMLFLLDGYDEVENIASNSGTELYQILRYVFAFKYVAVTSRPYYADKIAGKLLSEFQQFENIGFTNDNIKKYATDYFKEESEQQPFLNYLSNNRSVWGAAHVPINLALICWAWKDAKEAVEDKLNLPFRTPMTMTDLYKKIIKQLHQHCLKRSSIDLNKCEGDELQKKKPEMDNPVFYFLAYIGFEGMNRNTLYITKDIIDEGIKKTNEKFKPQKDFFARILKQGLLKSINETATWKLEMKKPHYFIHLTFQEFFAAAYIAYKLQMDQNSEDYKSAIDWINKQKKEKPYEVMWGFVAGLLKKKHNCLKIFLNELVKEPSQSNKIPLYLRCLEESELAMITEKCENEKNQINLENFIKETIDTIKKYLQSYHTYIHSVGKDYYEKITKNDLDNLKIIIHTLKECPTFYYKIFRTKIFESFFAAGKKVFDDYLEVKFRFIYGIENDDFSKTKSTDCSLLKELEARYQALSGKFKKHLNLMKKLNSSNSLDIISFLIEDEIQLKIEYTFYYLFGALGQSPKGINLVEFLSQIIKRYRDNTKFVLKGMGYNYKKETLARFWILAAKAFIQLEKNDNDINAKIKQNALQILLDAMGCMDEYIRGRAIYEFQDIVWLVKNDEKLLIVLLKNLEAKQKDNFLELDFCGDPNADENNKVGLALEMLLDNEPEFYKKIIDLIEEEKCCSERKFFSFLTKVSNRPATTEKVKVFLKKYLLESFSNLFLKGNEEQKLLAIEWMTKQDVIPELMYEGILNLSKTYDNVLTPAVIKIAAYRRDIKMICDLINQAKDIYLFDTLRDIDSYASLLKGDEEVVAAVIERIAKSPDDIWWAVKTAVKIVTGINLTTCNSNVEKKISTFLCAILTDSSVYKTSSDFKLDVITNILSSTQGSMNEDIKGDIYTIITSVLENGLEVGGGSLNQSQETETIARLKSKIFYLLRYLGNLQLSEDNFEKLKVSLQKNLYFSYPSGDFFYQDIIFRLRDSFYLQNPKQLYDFLPKIFFDGCEAKVVSCKEEKELEKIATTISLDSEQQKIVVIEVGNKKNQYLIVDRRGSKVKQYIFGNCQITDAIHINYSNAYLNLIEDDDRRRVLQVFKFQDIPDIQVQKVLVSFLDYINSKYYDLHIILEKDESDFSSGNKLQLEEQVFYLFPYEITEQGFVWPIKYKDKKVKGEQSSVIVNSSTGIQSRNMINLVNEYEFSTYTKLESLQIQGEILSLVVSCVFSKYNESIHKNYFRSQILNALGCMSEKDRQFKDDFYLNLIPLKHRKNYRLLMNSMYEPIDKQNNQDPLTLKQEGKFSKKEGLLNNEKEIEEEKENENKVYKNTKQSDNLINLNASGNDQNLLQNGNDTYWYSIGDGFKLMMWLRKKKLIYTDETNSPYKIKTVGEEYSYNRQNIQSIYISDPCYIDQLGNSFLEDMQVITGGYSGNKVGRNNLWTKMPQTLIIPILSGLHWTSIRIQINYEKQLIDVLYDDPYGLNGGEKEKLKNILMLLTAGIELLFKKEKKLPTFTLQEKNILKRYKSIDQQGKGKNGCDCGPITFSNINDYTNFEISNEQFVSSNSESSSYTVSVESSPNHEQQIKKIRNEDVKRYIEIANINVSEEQKNKQIQLNDQVKSSAEKKLLEIKEQIKDNNLLKPMKQISKLDPYTVMLIFALIESKRLSKKEEMNDPYTEQEIQDGYDEAISTKNKGKNEGNINKQDLQNNENKKINNDDAYYGANATKLNLNSMFQPKPKSPFNQSPPPSQQIPLPTEEGIKKSSLFGCHII